MAPHQWKMAAKMVQLKSEPSDKPICNICRQEDIPVNLLTPCHCKGTIGFVHFECVKRWIETSGTDRCGSCKQQYRKLVVQKKPGQFHKFFNESDYGIIFSNLVFFFFVMFYLSYFAQFHCRLAYIKGRMAIAIVICVFNSIYLILNTLLFYIYLIVVYVSFMEWRATHFDMLVLKAG